MDPAFSCLRGRGAEVQRRLVPIKAAADEPLTATNSNELVPGEILGRREGHRK